MRTLILIFAVAMIMFSVTKCYYSHYPPVGTEFPTKCCHKDKWDNWTCPGYCCDGESYHKCPSKCCE